MNLKVKTVASVASVLALIVGIQALAAGPNGDEGSNEAASVKEMIRSLSASEKEALTYKQQKFAKLPSSEKQRMRNLHQQITTHEKSKRLVATMENYNTWLNTLSASRRAEILAMPKEKRIAEIRNELDSQNRFRRKQRKLTQKDIEILNDFIDRFVVAHREELAKKKHPLVDELRDSPSSRRFILASAFMSDRRSGSNETQELFQVEDFTSVAEQLSDLPKGEYEAAPTNEEKHDLMMRWVGFALMIQMRPPQFKEEVLVKFGESLSAGERKDLEMLRRDKMLHELGRLYMESKMHSRRKFPGEMRDGRGDRNRRRGPGGDWGGRGDRGGRDRRDGPPRHRPGEDGPSPPQDRPESPPDRR